MSKKSKKRTANRNYQTQNQRRSSNPANLEHQEIEFKDKLIYDRVEKAVDQAEDVCRAIADAVIEEEHRKNDAMCAQNIAEAEEGWEYWSDEDFSDEDIPGQTRKSQEQIHQEI